MRRAGCVDLNMQDLWASVRSLCLYVPACCARIACSLHRARCVENDLKDVRVNQAAILRQAACFSRASSEFGPGRALLLAKLG